MRYGLAWFCLWIAAAPAAAQLAPLDAPDPVAVRAVFSHTAYRPGDRALLAVVFEMQPGWHINADAAQQQTVDFTPVHTTVAVEAPAWMTAGRMVWPTPYAFENPQFPEPVQVFDGRAVAIVPLEISADAPDGAASVSVSVRYQTCDDTTCLFPRTKEVVAGFDIAAGSAAPGEAVEADLFASYDDTAAPPPQNPRTGRGVGAMTAASIAGALALAFVGGALLNLMPCVLPVIPIKILGLVQAERDHGRRLLLGAVMSLGVLGFWVALGLVIALGASDQKAISELFGHWWFNMGLGAFIIALAVGLCGLFVIQLPRWVYAINPRHDSLPGAFGFGVMTGVLGTPCTGPFLGGAAATVLFTGPGMAMAIFAAIGLGMAIPYFVLTAWPKLIERLPRTGPASELIKQVLGLLMIAAGAFFVGVGVNVLRNDGTEHVYQWYWWLAAGLIVAAAVWMIVRTLAITSSTARRAIFTALGLLMAGSSLAFAYDATRPSAIDWTYYTPARLEQAQRDGNVVVLDFTADWCINCKVIERTVLETRPVIDATASPQVMAMKVDLTSSEAAGWKLLEEHQRVAIPLLVVLSPDGSTVFKQEVYSARQVVEAIATAKGVAR